MGTKESKSPVFRLRCWVSGVDWALRSMFLGLIWLYQQLLSPWLPRACRFEPSCSHYASQCMHQHSVAAALSLVVRRLLRCHPFHPGGYDPVPEAKATHQHHGDTPTRSPEPRLPAAPLCSPRCNSAHPPS